MSWQVLMENITDPAHVPHSHHGVEGACKATSQMVHGLFKQHDPAKPAGNMYTCCHVMFTSRVASSAQLRFGLCVSTQLSIGVHFDADPNI
jgi:phenylpropionate dioxygenase-like ring-hydroxylating dioxygenase large terminal subunit